MDERLRRWRLVLGRDADAAEAVGSELSAQDTRRDEALDAVYDADRTGGVARTAPAVARWLSDVRELFAPSTLHLLQRDAVDRLGLERLLLEPELLDAIEVDLDLAVALITLSEGMDDTLRDRAREVVQQVVDALVQQFHAPIEQAVRGALARRVTRRPAVADIDWNRTILKNLRHYDPVRRVLVPERLVGRSRHGRGLHEVVLCVDQSGSMSASVVHAAIAASALAAVPAVRTRLIAFDTRVVDLTEHLPDVMDVLFTAQLGGGTDIAQAVRAANDGLDDPKNAVLVLISDLFEGPDGRGLLATVRNLVDRGVRVICLLALGECGQPIYDAQVAAQLWALGVPCIASTPGHLPAVLATALSGGDVAGLASG